MSNLSPQFNTPRIVESGGLDIHSASAVVLTHGDDTHTIGIGIDSWVLASTNGYIHVASGSDTADYVVKEIRDSNGRRLDYQYVTPDELNATGAVYQLSVIPIGGLIFNITEDADTTPITAAESGAFAAAWADIIVTDAPLTAATRNRQPFDAPKVTIKLDSSTSDTSAGSLTCKLHGPAHVVGNPVYSATSLANPRIFRASIRSAGASL